MYVKGQQDLRMMNVKCVGARHKGKADNDNGQMTEDSRLRPARQDIQRSGKGHRSYQAASVDS